MNRGSHRRCSMKNVHLNFHNNLQGNTFVRVSFLINYLLSRTSLNGCFCMSYTHFHFTPLYGDLFSIWRQGEGAVISRVCSIGFGTEIYRCSIAWQKICDIIVFVMSQCVGCWHRLTNIKRHQLNSIIWDFT